MPERRLGWMVMGVLTLALALAANPATAQDDPRVGVVMGYPASIGIVWHVTDGIAVRPEVSVSRSTNDLTATSSITIGGTTSTSSSLNSNDNTQLLFGLSGLFYLSKHEGLRTYVSPRWAYTHVSSSSSSGPAGTSLSASTGSVQFVSGSIGAQYALGKRFSVFGELGLGYTHTVNSPLPPVPTVLSTASTSNTIATRSGAGVILYF